MNLHEIPQADLLALLKAVLEDAYELAEPRRGNDAAERIIDAHHVVREAVIEEPDPEVVERTKERLADVARRGGRLDAGWCEV